MDNTKPEDFEQPEQSFQKEADMAESRIRALERANSQKTEVVDATMTDKAGHPVTLRSWETDSGVMVRAYDTSKVEVPEDPNPGQAGHAEAHFDRSFDAQKRLRLNYIETNGEYRGTGVGGQMLNQVEQYAQKNGATEIYGSIENQDAQDFWKSQAGNGWEIDYSQGFYGHARKVMS